MKKQVFTVAALAFAIGFASCSSDDEKVMPEGTGEVTIHDNNLDVTAENVSTWTTYANAVARLLAKDAEDLNEAWATDYNGTPYATTFKTHGAPYTSAVSCLEQIVEGCIDIASEVGTAKIGEPRDLWEAGRYTEAVYAVESWYSFHSIDDYANNILSIRNAFNGTRDGSEAEHSLAALTRENNADLYNKVSTAIQTAHSAIKYGMTAPFRDHIGNASVLVAQDACAELETVLNNELIPFITSRGDDDELEAIVAAYVDDVVLPTYAELATRTARLRQAVAELHAQPATETFRRAAEAWMSAREPWETSEAFLFGPVAELGLDPNMDSWPLDVDAIKSVMESGHIEDLIQWKGEYDEDDEDIEAVQNVRGFHTLEFLLFKNGKPRIFEP